MNTIVRKLSRPLYAVTVTSIRRILQTIDGDVLRESRSIRKRQSARLISYSVKTVNVRKKTDQQTVTPDPPTEQNPPARSTTTSAGQGNSEKQSPVPAVTPQQTSVMIETVVGKVSDFTDGQMQEVDVGDKKAVLVKEDGQFYAVSSKCTHYGAPMAKGAYCKGVIRCPWHGACFNVKTGDIEDYPGLDSLQTYEVVLKGDQVIVKADPATLENHKRVKPMVKKVSNNQTTAVLVGGGPTSLVCAETLRQEGFTGRIILVSEESCLPYDRIKLSKALNVKPEEIALRKSEFYDENDIELMLGSQVTKVAVEDKKIFLDNGQTLNYDSLLLATGGQPRRLPTPGGDLKNVYVLRAPKDANVIAENAAGKNVIIVGSSFIGMEVAAFLADKARSVSVVDLVRVPFQLTLGKELGTFMQKLHESKGVNFHFGTSVAEFKGENGELTEAVLANGTTLPADVCVMGVGVVPSTDFIKESGINLTSRGFVTVNKNMKTNVPGVYAGGDIVEFPLFTAQDQSVNIQHWQMAHQHGRIAGLSIAGKDRDIRSVPYFWTMQYGKSVRYTGYAAGYDDIILHGDLDENKFVAYYTKGDNVVAVASLGWDPIVSQASELMSKGATLAKSDVQSDPTAWLSKLSQL